MKDLKPFQQVLVRSSEDDTWRVNLFSHTDPPFKCCVAGTWSMCIPYEGNEHLLGTCKSIEPEFSFGDRVEVRDLEGDVWVEAVYINKIYMKGQDNIENCRFLYNVVKRGSSMVRGVKFCRRVKN